MANSSTKDALHSITKHNNIVISGVGANEVLKFDGSNWINQTLAESGIAALSGAAFTGAITGVTALTVDNININGNTISSTAGTDLLITPLGGQQIVLDGTIIIDAGVVTAATSITSTEFVGGGVGLTALNGTQVTSGTLPAARIAADSIVEAKLNVSNGPTNGQVLTARDGVAGGYTWEAAAGTTINSNADNRVITGSGTANTLEGEQYLTFSGNNMVLQSTSNSSAQTSLYIESYKTSASGWHGGQLVLRQSHNATIGSHGAVQADYTLGNIDFEGSNGSAFYRSARIVVEAVGNWGSSDTGSRMKFLTTADGSATLTERMRITDDGSVTFTGIGCSLYVNSNQNVTSGSETHVITWAATTKDDYRDATYTSGLHDSGYSGGNNKIYAPIAGWYLIGAQATWQGGTQQGGRRVQILVNTGATGIDRFTPVSNDDPRHIVSIVHYMNADDYIEIEAAQYSGVTKYLIATHTRFWMVKVG